MSGVRLLSPEAEVGGGKVLPVADAAKRAIDECGGLRAAIQWARTWEHRPYFKRMVKVLRAKEVS